MADEQKLLGLREVEKRLANLFLEFQEKQLNLFDTQQGQLGEQQDILTTQLDQLDLATQSALQRADGDDQLFEEIQQQELARLRQGGFATEQERALIGDVTQKTLDTGLGDIRSFAQQQLEDVRDILAPRRGLRPTDTPIQDVGSRIGREATQQAGQLERALRAQQAQSTLEFPLQRATALSGIGQFQQQLAETSRNFAAGLRQQALTNRLALAGFQQSGGLGLLGIPTGGTTALTTAAARLTPQPQTQRVGESLSSRLSAIGTAAGGIGGLIEGIGSIF